MKKISIWRKLSFIPSRPATYVMMCRTKKRIQNMESTIGMEQTSGCVFCPRSSYHCIYVLIHRLTPTFSLFRIQQSRGRSFALANRAADSAKVDSDSIDRQIKQDTLKFRGELKVLILGELSYLSRKISAL
jgi:hypothetical protein